MTNRKEVVNHRGSNKDIRKTKRAMSVSGTHGSDRKTRTIGDHDGRRVGGRRMNRREYTRVGVVWKVAPESTIQSGPTGGVRVMVPKERAKAVGSQPTGPGEN